MKKCLLFLFFVPCFNFFSQEKEYQISYVSKNRDTLWLINDNVGKLIASSWDDTKNKEKKPVIIMVDVLPSDHKEETSARKGE